eukprot:4408655-Amphidinium_carterae.1
MEMVSVTFRVEYETQPEAYIWFIESRGDCVGGGCRRGQCSCTDAGMCARVALPPLSQEIGSWDPTKAYIRRECCDRKPPKKDWHALATARVEGRPDGRPPQEPNPWE